MFGPGGEGCGGANRGVTTIAGSSPAATIIGAQKAPATVALQPLLAQGKSRFFSRANRSQNIAASRPQRPRPLQYLQNASLARFRQKRKRSRLARPPLLLAACRAAQIFPAGRPAAFRAGYSPMPPPNPRPLPPLPTIPRLP